MQCECTRCPNTITIQLLMRIIRKGTNIQWRWKGNRKNSEVELVPKQREKGSSTKGRAWILCSIQSDPLQWEIDIPSNPPRSSQARALPAQSVRGLNLTNSVSLRRDFTHICSFLIFQPQRDWLVGSPISSSRYQPQGYCLSLEVSGTRTLRKSSSAKWRSNGLAQNCSSFCFWSWIQMISGASTKTGPCRGHGAYKLHPRFSTSSSRDREASVSGLLVEYLAVWLRWGGRRDQESRLPGLCLPSSNMPL